jgi:hypothetical protein
MKRKHANAVHVSLVMPETLKTRLVRRAAQETADSGQQVMLSEIVRYAIEEYLDLYEGATFVPDTTGAAKETPPPRSS